jgi:putative Mn2+ efflux pump MntP
VERAVSAGRRAALGGSLWSYAAAGLAVSLDELAAGIGLGVVRVPWQLVIPWVAVQGYALTWLGLALGARLGESFEHWTGRLTVVAFAALGLFFLAEAAGLVSL